MADRVLPGPVESGSCPVGAQVNIHTNKIFDCCRDKDCVEDLRVYLTESSQAVANTAFNIRPGSATLVYADINVDEISFNRGFYTVDVSYYYIVTGTASPGSVPVMGLAVFDKRAILYGSEGTVKTFSSDDISVYPPGLRQANPTAYVEAVDPIILNMRLTDNDGCCVCESELRTIPPAVAALFSENLVLDTASRRLYATLGQFSIIRLERDTQLQLDDVSYFIPDKECTGSGEDDPCALFGRVRFPTEEFFPPDEISDTSEYRNLV